MFYALGMNTLKLFWRKLCQAFIIFFPVPAILPGIKIIKNIIN